MHQTFSLRSSAFRTKRELESFRLGLNILFNPNHGLLIGDYLPEISLGREEGEEGKETNLAREEKNV